jgi:arsenical pump membrane protein
VSATLATVLGLLVLAAVLAFAVIRPRNLPEAVAAVPAALLVLAIGLVPLRDAGRSLAELGPTIGFLAAVLVLSHLADADGVFRWLGAVIGRSARGAGGRLLLATFAAAAVTTAVLSLDATVVLLTPVVLAAVRHARLRPAPPLYATAHLSNSASLLLPVSNLTNLLAFRASGLTFLGFAAVMALPWLLTLGVEYLVHRRYFRSELREPPDGAAETEELPRPPVTSLVLLSAVLAGFVVGQFVHVEPVWVATAGAVVFAVRALVLRRVRPAALIGSTQPAFLVFVAALAVVVDAATGHGLQDALTRVLPTGTSLPALLALTGIAAVLANVVNNLPATLVLLAALGAAPAPAAVLAVLVGVNIGPNLSYPGSLATLLWRRILRAADIRPSLRRWTVLGLLTVPPAAVLSTAAIWLVAG